jgi:hypothetical protein
MYHSHRGIVLTTTPWVEHLALVPFEVAWLVVMENQKVISFDF